MSSIDLTPLYRSTIGFDRLASMLNSALSSDNSATSYPPYNIEMLEENKYAITLAVAGFSQDELDIQVENNVLTVRGQKKQEQEHKFLYQGIATRTFERKFNLADYVEIVGANLTNGLLNISLVKEVPEAMKPKRIAINSNDEKVIEHKAQDEIKKDSKAA